MVNVFAVTLVDNPFTLQHSSGLVSLRPFLLDLWCAVIVGILLLVVSSHLITFITRCDLPDAALRRSPVSAMKPLRIKGANRGEMV